MKHLKLFFALFAMLALGVGNAWAEEVTFSFADATQRVSQDGNSQVWKSGEVVFTNAKGTGNAVVSNTNPIRCYQGSSITIEAPGNISKLVFVCNTNAYATALGNSISSGDEVSSKNVTVTTSGSATYTISSLSAQVRINSLTVTYEAGSTTPKQEYTLTYQAGSVTGSLKVEEGANLLDALKDITPEACDPTSTEPIGWSESEITTKQANSPTLLTDADVMPSEAHSVYYVFAKKETTSGGAATEKTGEYTFATYTAGTQYATNEEHKLDDDVTIYTNDCHFTSELRIYSSSTNNGYVVSNELPGKIVSMGFNAGNKVDVLVVSGSTDGNTWNQVGEVSVTSTSYKDYTLSFGETNYTYFKLDVKGANQVRLKKMSVTYMSGGGTTTISDYTTSCGTAPEPAVLVSIVANAEGKNAFTEGDEFVKATITATYDDETKKDVTSLATFTGYDMNTTGTQTVTVTYEEQTTTYQITVNAKTPATLILSKNGVEEALEGEHKVGDVVTLPSFTSDCVKQFVGWSTEEIEESLPEKPTSNFYEPGADFTLTAEEHILYAVYATAAEGELTSIFSETFDACDGTGGNDGEWSGTVAQGDLPDELSSTWTFIKGTKANECAKFGTSTVKGSAETPAITLSGSAKLTFKSAAWDGSKEQTTLNVSATGATLSQTSVTLDKGSWNAYTIGITEATGSVKIKFEAVVDDNNRFFLDDVVVSQGSITYSDYSTTCAVAPDAPEFSVAAGTYNAAQTVTITAEDGATIYYTLDGNNPTNESNVYSSALTISETTTLKAIAVKDGLSSAITTATYTIKLPLTTIDQIFAKATEVGGTATAVEITMGGWTVSGANDKNVFVTDGTKGFIIYKSDEGHGFNVGDVLSGTVACKVQLFKGSAELTELTSSTSGLTVTTGGTVTPVTLNAAGITALTGINTGSVIKINGTCTLENSKYYVAGVQLYNTLYEFQTLEPSAEYNVTGVYQLYTTTKEILPRQEADIEKIESLPTATISIADITMEVEETKTITATIYPAAAADAVVYSTTSSCISISGNTITGVTEGTATVTATIANADGEYYGTTKDFTVTVTPKSTKDNVVVLAKYGDQWYAMMAQYVSGKTSHLAALPVSYVGGKLYNVTDADKTLIEWTRAVVDGKATFSNNSKYLTGKSDKTDLTLAATSCDWTISGESYLIGERTFFYNAENNWFRNFKIENVDAKNYSGMPVVTAPVYVNLNTASVKTVENAYFSVGNNKYVQFSTGNLQYEVGTNTWSFAEKQYEVVGGATYDPANPTNTNYGMNEPGYTGKLDLFGWSSDGKFGVNPSNTDADYGKNGVNEFVDWGTLVNETGWYTLTKDEMNYILNRKKDKKNLWTLATVCDMNGLILLPDNWNTSITLEYGYIPTDWKYTENRLDATAWAALEAAGAVFLPEGGSRVGGHGNKDQGGGPAEFDAHDDYFHVDNVGEMGYYWLNTQDDRADYEYFASFLILPGWSDNDTPNDESDDVALAPQVWSREKRRGNSVRLVKEVTPYTRDNQGAGVYGTVCYPENIVWVDGATLYEVAGKEGNKVIFDEVTTPEAGMPYIFIAEQEKVNFFCGSATATEAGEHNSLQGTFTEIQDTEAGAAGNILEGNYVLYNNIIKRCGANCGLHANRAYFVADDLELLGAPTASQAPGRRRISLDVQSENTTTDLDNITNGENTTIKTIENGQLIIIRNGEKFNAQGIKF